MTVALSKKISPKARTKARERALQALYQWHFTGQSVQEIEEQFLMEQNMSKADIPYFQKLLHGVPEQLNELDKGFGRFLDRPLPQIDPIELAILRIGCYELTFCPEVPYSVVIDEAIELAKKFGAEKSHKYVNGVLDKLAHALAKKPHSLSLSKS